MKIVPICENHLYFVWQEKFRSNLVTTSMVGREKGQRLYIFFINIERYTLGLLGQVKEEELNFLVDICWHNL